jgi:hypothetical protein
MSKNLIINVACRKPYTAYQQRLIASCNKFHPFYKVWTDEYPPGSLTHQESLYGFKVHAFKEAFRLGYDNVLWLDSPAYLLDDPLPIFNQIEADGHYLINGEIPLWPHINKRTADHFGMTNEAIKRGDYRLLSGSFIGLHKDSPILHQWAWYEENGFFLSASEDAQQEIEFEGYQGFRHDESVLSMIAYTTKYKTVNVWDSHFQSNNAIVKAEKW